MDIPVELLSIGIPGLVAGGVAFGMVRGMMHNKIGFDTHRQICHAKSTETNEVLRSVQEDIKTLIKGQGEIAGYVKGVQNGK